MVQTDYSLARQVANAGLLAADMGPYDIETTLNREGAALPYGIGVTRHSSVAKATIEINNAYDLIKGLALRSHSLVTADLSGSLAIDDKRAFNLLRKGYAYVQVEEAVVDGDPVFIRHVTDGGSNTQPGTFRTSIDSNRARRLHGATFRSAAAASGYAVVEFDFTEEDRIAEDLYTDEYLETAAMTADTTRSVINVPDDRYIFITGAQIRNETGLAAHATNFFNTKLQTPAGALIAGWSTEDSAEGALVADTVHEMTLGTAANRLLNPGDLAEIFFDEDGTATMPANTVVSWQGYLL